LEDRARKLSRDSQDRIADSSAMANESLSAIQIVQAFTAQSAKSDARFALSVERFLRNRRQPHLCARRTNRNRHPDCFWRHCRTVVAWGMPRLSIGSLSAGTLSQFVLYAVLVAGSVGTLAEVWGDIQRASGATGRPGVELLNIPVDIAAPATPKHLPMPIKGAVEFHAVTFTSAARPERSALRDINFAIAPGRRPWPSWGHQELARQRSSSCCCVSGDPTKGAVTIDGVDIRDLDPIELRRTLGLVPQDAILFAGSVADNIRYGRLDANDDEVMAAAKVSRRP